MGTIRVPLAYYHCPACRRGLKPGEARWGLEKRQLTAGAEQVVALAGGMVSFREASERVLRTMCGLKLSESTVERTAEGVGQKVAEQLAEGRPFGPRKSWAWQQDAQGRRCAYVSVDATGVPQQGPGGQRAEGRMAYVATVYNPRLGLEGAGGGQGEVRYLAGFYDLTTLGRRLHEQALEVGWAEAEQQVAISDGGSGLEDFFRTHFPKAECILDFWHAKEHLVELGQALYPKDEPQRKQWTDQACHRLKHEGGRAVREWLEGLELSDASAELKEEHRRQVQYFRNHEHKMDYPRYLRGRLADRLRAGGIGLQDRGRQPAERRRHALGGTRLPRNLPPPRTLPQ